MKLKGVLSVTDVHSDRHTKNISISRALIGGNEEYFFIARCTIERNARHYT